MAVGLLATGSLVAHADELVTTLPVSGEHVNGRPEVLALDGGSGQTTVVIRATSGSGQDKPGCDLAGGTVVIHPWANSTAVQVAPDTLVFTACDAPQAITVTRTRPGHAMVKFSFDRTASSKGVTGPDVETAHFVVGGDTEPEGPGCTPPAAPTFSPDGAASSWFTAAPVVAAGNGGGDPIDYASAAAGPFSTSAPTLTDGTTTVFARAVNDCGETISDTTFHVDSVAPSVVRTATNADFSPYVAGTWTNQTVTVHTECSDATSGVVAGSCPADVVVEADSADAGGTTVPAAPVLDVAGNSASAPAFVVKRDTVPPTAVRTTTVTGGAAYAPGTWTNRTVTVHTECSDALSGVASCPADVVVDTDSATSAGTTVPAAAATDLAGNGTDAPSVVVKRDTVAPTVTVTGLSSSYVTGGTPPTPSCLVVDALSGSAGTPSPVVTPPANPNGVGTWTVTCSGSDNAGNASTSLPSTYNLNYGGVGSGWLQPILAGTKFSRGKAVPGKFKVGGSPLVTGFATGGWKITAEPQPVGSKLGCVAQVGAFALKSLNTADLKPTMRWDATGQQYVLNADFRTATVGSCWQLKAVLDDSPATTFSSGTFQITN